MTAEGPGRRELTELVTNHLLRHIDGNVLSAVMNGDGMSNHFWKNRAVSRPGANDPAVTTAIHGLDLLPQLGIDVRTFLG
jgi:hypothetical protein